jgi:hypothetical protein
MKEILKINAQKILPIPPLGVAGAWTAGTLNILY